MLAKIVYRPCDQMYALLLFIQIYSRPEQISIDADYNLDSGLRSYVNFKDSHHQPRYDLFTVTYLLGIFTIW